MTYVVIENTPGYLPDNDDPGVYENIEQAKEALKDEVTRYIEQWQDGLETESEPNQHWSDDGESCIVVSNRKHDLGRVFEIVLQADSGD